jgi:uncharacterized FlaG/YvyC family protein
MYLTGKIWNIGDLVEANGVEGRVIRKGTNYLAYNDSQGKVHKVWLHEININEKVRRVKQDPDIKGDKGTEPAKYYAKDAAGKKMSVKTKRARDDEFERRTKMSDDDPAVYEPAPGDLDKSGKLKKTKPSKHTQKFKKMFGDDVNEVMPALARLATVKPSTYAGAAAAIGQAASKMKPKTTSSKSRKLSREENEIDERTLSKSQQDRLDDLEAFLGHLQRLRTPRKAEIEATKKKIAKLKSEFDPDSIDESWSIDEMTGINVPELIKTTIFRLTHPKGYRDIIQKYAERVKQTTGKPSNGAILSDIARQFGFDRVKPIQMYINKLVQKGRLPQELAAEYEGQDMEEDFQLDEKIGGLVKKSEKTGVPYGILKKSYDRGMAAWRTGHRPGTTPQQWAFARVNSMLTGGKADPDLQAKIRAGGYKKKKKKAKKEDLNLDEMQINRWYESIDTRLKYQLDHGDDWWWKMNEVHDKLLERFGYTQGCDIEDETPKKRMTMKEVALRNMWGEIDEAAEYNGRPVKLNNPTRGDVKKYKVYVRNDKGNVVKVEFGDPNMEIKRDDPARRKSFRARHNCDNPGPKYKARFWSCKFWEKGKTVTDLMKG